MPDAKEIVGRITKARRRALVELPDEFSFWPIHIAHATIKRLIEDGLLLQRSPNGGFGMVVHHWTPLGLEVRAILTRSKEAENADS